MLNTRTSAHQSSTIKNKTMSSDDKRLKIHTVTGKYILLLVLLCSATVGLFAQDVITKTDGTEIQATVTQIGVNEIKYIRYGTTAPVYTLLKSDIFMIKYEDGTKDVFKKEPAQRVNRQQTYNNNTALYDTPLKTYKYTCGDPINPNGARKSAFGSGIASFFIPGLGQFINGDVGGGFLFLGTNIICNTVMLNTRNEGVFVAALLGGITINIRSIVNAAQVAKRVNIARGYQLGSNTYLQIQPTIMPQNNLFQPNDYAYGMNVRVSF